MTDEEVLDWLYRIKSNLKIYFPLKWADKCELAIDYAISKLKGEHDIAYWTVKQYYVPIENKQIPTVLNTTVCEPTSCKIVYSYTHSFCKSEEYLNKYKYCPNCGARMKDECKSNG